MWKICQQRTFSSLKFGNGVFEMTGNLVTKTSRTSRGIGFPTSCDNEFITSEGLVCGLKDKLVVYLFNRNNLCLGSNLPTKFSDFLFQSFDNGPRFVTGRKDAAVVFDLKFNTIFCKKVNDIMVIKLGEDTVEKAPISRDSS